MLWKIYFIGRAENNIAQSNFYKVEADSSARAFSRAIAFTEQHSRIRLIEVTDASARIIGQTEWNTEDGSTIL